MRKLIFISTLFLILACQKTPQAPIPQTIITPEDQEVLRNFKEVLWPKAYREQDTVLLDKLLGEDFQMVDASGAWTKKTDELEWIKHNAANYDSFQYEIKRFDILDNGTAVICGTGHILNDSIETIYQSSNILIKRNGTWKAIASHVSGIKKLD